MIFNLPNILTVFRLIAAPLVPLVFLFVVRPYADWLALVLFASASITDWFDGYLARSWNQTTKLGTMLDPIADKAMVVTALMTLTALYGVSVWILLPAVVIMFRETFVSGLREYLGDTAGTLKVTKLAKWKTTVQMVAVSVLLAHGIFKYGAGAGSAGEFWTYLGGIALLWLAGALTLITGWDYFRKATPYLKD